MRKYLSAKLCDDYEAGQLNPVYSGTQEGEASHEEIVKEIGQLPEKDSMRARIAVFEAIVDTVVEEEIKEATTTEDESPRTKEITEVVENITDKAVAMHLVPYTFKSYIPAIVSRHLKRTDPRVQLLAKAAHFVMDAETVVPAAAETPSTTIATPDDTNNVPQDDITQQIENTTPDDVEKALDDDETAGSMRARLVKQAYARFMSGEITETEFKEEVQGAGVTNANPSAEAPENDKVEEDETPVVEGADVEVPADVPTQMAKALRYLASTSVNHRNATTLVSRSLSGPMLSEMLHVLRHHLPAKFVSKYHVN